MKKDTTSAAKIHRAGCSCDQCYAEFVAYWYEASPLVAEFGTIAAPSPIVREAFLAGAAWIQKQRQAKEEGVLEALRP